MTRRRCSKLLGIVPAVISVIAFILTEDMSLPMQLIDRWTLLMVIILLVNVALALITRNTREDEEDEEQNGESELQMA